MSKDRLPVPKKEEIIYEDKLLYVCLARFPIARGHCIVVWKTDVSDLHMLSRKKYEYLMDIVDATRNALLKVLKIKKVYLLYMDEVQHVHWHLVPRYHAKGLAAFQQRSSSRVNFSLVEKLRHRFSCVH